MICIALSAFLPASEQYFSASVLALETASERHFSASFSLFMRSSETNLSAFSCAASTYLAASDHASERALASSSERIFLLSIAEISASRTRSIDDFDIFSPTLLFILQFPKGGGIPAAGLSALLPKREKKRHSSLIITYVFAFDNSFFI